MSDFRWQGLGGCLLDGSGDLAMYASPLDSLQDMIRTRLKADLLGWKLYAIGADLRQCLGDAVVPELELRIRRQVSASLIKQLLPPGSFEVRTVANGGLIDLYVYLGQSLLATVTLDREQGIVQVA